MSVRVFAFMSIGLCFASSALAAPAITVAGSCPGVVNIGLTGATANGSTALVTGKAGGLTVLAAGPCAGTMVNVGKAVVRAIGNASATGTRTLSPTLPAGACASNAQWLDQTTCQLSPPVSLSPTCLQPVTNWGDTGPATVGPPYMADPAGVSFWAWANNGNGLRENFTDPVGPVDIPATLVVDYFDNVNNYMCSNYFDVALATADPTYTAVSIDPMGNVTANPVVPAAPVSVVLTGGFTDCAPIDPNGVLGAQLGNSNDLRVGWQGAAFDFAYGAKISTDMKNTIVPLLANGLAEWNADWAPFVIGDTFLGIELGWSATLGRTCATLDIDPVTLDYVQLPKPKGAVSENQIGTDFWVLPL